MASIRKRLPQTANGKERWLADYVDQSGKRRNKSFATKKAATAWLDIAKIEVANGVHTPASADITIREAGELWLRQGEADGLEASTLRQYRQHLNLHILPFIGRIKLAELSPGHLQELRDRLLFEGRSRDMTRRVTVSLGALLATAMAYGKVARNVVRDQARQRGTRERRLENRHDRQLEIGVDIPTKDEIRALLDAAAVVAGGRWRPLLLTAVLADCVPVSCADCAGMMSTLPPSP
jgi:hypothetical protein